MAEPVVTPLALKNPLAPTPDQDPKWAQEVTLKGGDKVKMADPRATRAMVSLMDMQAVLGGAASHFGGPSAFAELMAAAYGLVFHRANKENKPWYEVAHLINDAGHCENGIYALKANYGFADLTLESLKGFRSIQSKLTGHGESHLFADGVYLSNGPLGSSLPQAQGLAFADHLAGRNRLTITAISDGACMEGEAREALAAIPGLAQKGKMAPFVLIVSDNNTKLTGRIDKDSFSMQPSFESLATQGWKVLHMAHPHDLQACVTVLEEAMAQAEANPKQPVAIHAKTIKGYGVKATEESASGGHGFPLKEPGQLPTFLSEIYGGETVPADFQAWVEEMVTQHNGKKSSPGGSSSIPSEKIQKGVSAALIRKRKEGLPILSISSDLPGSTGTADFQKAFPECTQDVGVAEANMVSVAAGLSKEGFIPVVDTFAQFGVTKGALPLMMASLSQAPMLAFFSHTGFQDAADGASHQALSWLGMTASIPHCETYALTCSDEADALVGQAVDRFHKMRKEGKVPPTTIFFLGRENFPRSYSSEGAKYELGKAQILADTSAGKNKSVTLLVGGSLAPHALAAAETLATEGIGALVVNASCLGSPDVATLKQCLAKTEGRLVTAEDHQLVGGMGAIAVHALAQEGAALRVKSLGVNGEFGQSAYLADELYAKHGIDSRAMAEAARSL
ncbi:MAG: transketolase [Bdellovibrionaceae bacterium]|nr:transketolase [Bdellovibrionales bacterium]MCB9084913.1 transketolase [Pseudobdellovibrionaceae bacterium]